MSRYLFGPIDPGFAAEHLYAFRASGECLVFGHKPDPGLDFHIGANDSWNDVLARLPTGWSPDYVVLRLEYATVPFGLWSAPVPLVGLAGDANLLWTAYRQTLPCCDLVLADLPSVTALRRNGLKSVLPANLYGCGRSWLEEHAEGERDIDVLFVGNLHPAVQRERQAWLGKVAALASRWRIRIATGVFGTAYRDLVRRARIVFNRSVKGESNQRVAEVVSSGALLFQERGNSEVAAQLGNPRGCVFYEEGDLEELISYYLEHESERAALVEVARARLPSMTFEARWAAAVGNVEEALPAARLRASKRARLKGKEGLLVRAAQWLSSVHRDADPTLKADLARTLEHGPADADLHLALGLILSVGGDVAAAADCFGRATAASRGAPLPGLSLVASLAAMGQTKAAIDGARKLLTRLENIPTLATSGPDLGAFPPLFDYFRVEWERAGFDHAGDARSYVRSLHALLRWRLFGLLANLTGDLSVRYEAVLARPDLPVSRAELGCALGRAGNPVDAVSHLRAALAGNPFDQQAARALGVGLRDSGQSEAAEQLAHSRRLLARAALGVVPMEPWFEQRKNRPSERPTEDKAVRPVTVRDGTYTNALGRYQGRVSLCMIVKNEEDNLPACLDSVAGLFDEIIVVDTGSQDQTKQLAEARGARVSEFPWINDFAAARNASLERATGDWIFWLDADDRLDTANREKLKRLFESLTDEHVAYAMQCLCVPRDDNDGGTVVDHIRLFRRHPDVRWEFRVHEQILGAVRRSGGTVRKVDIVIRHVGYVDPALRRRKLDRDLNLLELEEKQRPGHPFTLFNLGQVLREMGRPADAVLVLRRSLEQSHPNDSIVRKLFALLAQCLRELNRTGEALAAVNQGLEACPDDSELLFARGIMLMAQGDMIGAEGSYRRLLSTSDDATFTSVTEGLRGHQARNNLAAVLQKQGRVAEAELQWREALAEKPGYPPSMLGLGEVLLIQERWSELEEHLTAWESRRPQDRAAVVLRAKGHMARRDFGDARSLLEQTLSQMPEDTWVWAVLSHCLLQEGRDLDAAEKALRKVLDLDSSNTEAKRNLEVLLRHRQAVPSEAQQ